MKKVLTCLVVLVMFAGTAGCKLFDNLFYKTAAVNPSELGSFNGDIASSKEEVLDAFVIGIGTSAFTFISSMSSSELATFSEKVAPTFSKLTKAYPQALKSKIQALKTVGRSTASSITKDGDTDASDGAVDFTYEFDNEDFDSNGILTLNGKLAAKANGLTDDSYPLEASGSGEADLQAVVTAIEDTAFNGGKINFKAKGHGLVTATDYYYSNVEGYLAIVMNAGFSIDSSDYSKGGKFIVTFKFVENVYSQIDRSDLPGTVDSIDISITVMVYDNNNQLVDTYEYTTDDIENYIANYNPYLRE